MHAERCRAVYSALAIIVMLACACAGPPSAPPPSPAHVAIAPSRSDAGIVTKLEDDAPRTRLLEAMDAGDLARSHAALSSLERSMVTASFERALAAPPPWANAALVKVAPLPPTTAKASRVPLLVATRGKSAPGMQSQADTQRFGESFTDGLGRPMTDKTPPPFVPPRLGSAPVATLRSLDGRFVAIYRERFIAVFAADGTAIALLDLASWASGSPARRFARMLDVELDRDLLYVSSDADDVPFVAAIELATGAVRFRSDVESSVARLAVVTHGVLAYRHRTTQNGSGEILLFDRKTGATIGRRATPEIEGGAEAIFVVADDAVTAYASSELYGGKGLRHDEHLAFRIAATRRPPPIVPPQSVPSVTKLPATPAKRARDDRLVAWRVMEADPRAALLAMQREVESDPTGFASSVLFATADRALADARVRAEKALASMKPIHLADDPPSGRAPIARTRPRTLKLGARRSVTTADLASVFDNGDDAEIAPAWVPDALLARRRREDASDPATGTRIDVFSEPYKTALVVPWHEGRPRAVLEHDADVRFAIASDDVAFLSVLASGGFVLEARDVKTGTTHWRLPGVTDRATVIRDGYIVVGAASAAELLLVEADSGRVASRVPAGGSVELVVARHEKILALVIVPPGRMELVEVALD